MGLSLCRDFSGQQLKWSLSWTWLRNSVHM